MWNSTLYHIPPPQFHFTVPTIYHSSTNVNRINSSRVEYIACYLVKYTFHSGSVSSGTECDSSVSVCNYFFFSLIIINNNCSFCYCCLFKQIPSLFKRLNDTIIKFMNNRLNLYYFLKF